MGNTGDKRQGWGGDWHSVWVGRGRAGGVVEKKPTGVLERTRRKGWREWADGDEVRLRSQTRWRQLQSSG